MKVVAIHGIGQTFEGSETLKASWLPALQSGLREAGVEPVAAEEVGAVAYGALFRPGGNRSGNVPMLTAEDIDQDWEAEMLLLWWTAAAELAEQARHANRKDDRAENPSIQPPDLEGRGRTAEIIQRGLRQLSKSRFFRGMGPQRMLIFGLKQVRQFLYDPLLKAAVLGRVEAAVSAETKVIVAHSLGSIVAYEALCKHPEWGVHALVTLGSPLGIGGLVFDALTPRPRKGQALWPYVKRWINIADRGDVVALEKSLAPRFGSVEDVLVYNGHESHSILRYLTARETGLAIGSCLAEAQP